MLLRDTSQTDEQAIATVSVCHSMSIKAVYLLNNREAAPIRLWQRHTPFSPPSSPPPPKYELVSKESLLLNLNSERDNSLQQYDVDQLWRHLFFQWWLNKSRTTIIPSGTFIVFISFLAISLRVYRVWATKEGNNYSFLTIPASSVSLLVCN